MCYQESRWHAFCNHTIVTRVPCPTPTSCAQHLGQVDIDIIETHVTTHCHRCRDKVDNLGVKTPAAKRSAHQKKSSMSEGQQQQQHKKAESEDLSGLNNKRWSPRTPKSAAATTTTTTTTRAPRQLSSSTSMDNLRRPSTTTFSAFLPRTTTAAAAAASKPLRGTPGRVLHPAASMGDLRQRRARSSSDSASVAPSSLSSPRQQHIAAALTGYRSSSLTGRKASTGDVMRPCVDNASYKQWEAADAKPWSMFDLLVSPAPPPKSSLGAMTDDSETETIPTPATAVVTTPNSTTASTSSGSSPPAPAHTPTYSFTPKIRPPPLNLASNKRPPRSMATTTASSAPTTAKSPTRSVFHSFGLRRTKKPQSTSNIFSFHHHKKGPVSPVAPFVEAPVRPPRSPPLPPTPRRSLQDKPLPPPPLEIDHRYQQTITSDDDAIWLAAKQHRWDTYDIMVVKATV